MSFDIPLFFKMGKVELLSPAGDLKCFNAAVNAGADAVYMGLSKYGARAYAANFTEDELKYALETAHILDRKVYLTVNTLLKDNEMDGLYDLLKAPYMQGLSGVIVQDPGVISYIHRTFCDLPIHVSTQACVTSSECAGFYKKLGVTRIVPARELSIDEIRKMKEETNLELECFIHGSMCYSYSGRCLLSSFIGGRSGNRGRCAGPCRLMYDGKYPLSLKDMCTLKMIPELIDAGISSFKIEGRMKSADYVYNVTSIYRKYIDSYHKSGKADIVPEDLTKLISCYTRSGNCEGYYHKHNGKDMITIDSPSYETTPSEDKNSDITAIPAADVSVRCSIKKDQKISITASDDRFEEMTETCIIPEIARGTGLEKGEVILQLKKSGGTGLNVSKVDLDLDEGLFLAKSQLNSVRREGLAAFKDKILAAHKRQMPEKKAALYVANEEARIIETLPAVNVSILDENQFDVLLKSAADGIIVPLSLASQIDLSKKNINKKKIYLSLPYVVRNEGLDNSPEKIIEKIQKIIKKTSIAGFYVSCPEEVSILKTAGYELPITADIHMYAYNNEAYDLIKKWGVDKTTVPVELNRREMIDRSITGEELMIYGRIPVMISANCIVKTQKACQKERAGHGVYLKDRKGAKLFVSCNCTECTNVYYNSEVLSIADETELFSRIRPSSVRFSFTNEAPEDITRILETYISGRNDNGSTDKKLIDRYTKGHINRGID